MSSPQITQQPQQPQKTQPTEEEKRAKRRAWQTKISICPECDLGYKNAYKHLHLKTKKHLKYKALKEYRENNDEHLFNILKSTVLELRKVLGKKPNKTELEILTNVLNPNNIKKILKSDTWKTSDDLLAELNKNKK